jgi:transcriptional regulator with XRE-family HTH domain
MARADCEGKMELAEKLRRLRKAEGLRRGLWRAMTQHEVTHAMRQEIGVSLSQAYLSQLEGGRRVHLTNTTREALARFYHVHPGYLVSDPPGYAGAHDATPPPGVAGLGVSDASAALLDTALARLAASPEPARMLRLLDWLLCLAPEELATLEERMDAYAEIAGATLARDCNRKRTH